MQYFEAIIVLLSTAISQWPRSCKACAAVILIANRNTDEAWGIAETKVQCCILSDRATYIVELAVAVP